MVVMALVAFGTLMMIGGNEPPASDNKAHEKTSEVVNKVPKKKKANKEIEEAALLEEEESSLLGKVMVNLAVLDYAPGPDELKTQDGSMTIKDSIEGANWPLTFVPKILAIALALLVFLPWMINKLTDFTRHMIELIPSLAG